MTEYTLVEDQGATVLRADAHGSASGLAREVSPDVADYPIIEWRWKAAGLVAKGDPHFKESDDYVARLYVGFKADPARMTTLERAKHVLIKLVYGVEPPYKSINYIWDAVTPIGMILPNPFADEVRMIVVESGAANLGRWVTVERNLREDYRSAFGEEPPLVQGVALMTDCDNTGESATAWYGDIVMKRKRD